MVVPPLPIEEGLIMPITNEQRLAKVLWAATKPRSSWETLNEMAEAYSPNSFSSINSAKEIVEAYLLMAREAIEDGWVWQPSQDTHGL